MSRRSVLARVLRVDIEGNLSRWRQHPSKRASRRERVVLVVDHGWPADVTVGPFTFDISGVTDPARARQVRLTFRLSRRTLVVLRVTRWPR